MNIGFVGGADSTRSIRNLTHVGGQRESGVTKKEAKIPARGDSVDIQSGSKAEIAPEADKKAPLEQKEEVSVQQGAVSDSGVIQNEGKTYYQNPNGTLTSLQGSYRATDGKVSNRTWPVFEYIRDSWRTLRRSTTNAASLRDSKAGAPILYVPEQDMMNVAKDNPGLNIRPIRRGTGFPDVENHGLLYLPNDYIVPGGRFNEMYGWDSYFTVLGLNQSDETKTAEGMVRNMFYQVDNYGKILNANRSYYLSRSSPPFQSSAVRSVYEKTGDKKFLKEGIDHVIKEYNYWTNPQNEKEMDHKTPTGLSRYYSPVEVKCPEVEEGYYEENNLPVNDPQFCKHDRAERESGWDMTARYDYKCADYNPVDLNCFLFKYEKDLAVMYREIEGPDSTNAKNWDGKAAERRELINKHCWNEEKGMYVDYNFREGKQSDFESLATFAPLWAGVADEHQAAKIMGNLDKFEMEHGLTTTSEESGNRAEGKQWDHPAGWAPLHILAAKGMRNYGYNKEADRVSVKFLDTITKNFDRAGGILEKYDVVKGSSNVDVGYGNQVGFGWTNAAFLELYDDMSGEARQQLDNPQAK